MNNILSTYDWLYGIAQIAAGFLALVAGLFSIQLFLNAMKKKALYAWKFLALALILFVIEEVLGTVEAFGIAQLPFVTHIIPTFILGALIIAMITQLNINRGCVR